MDREYQLFKRGEGTNMRLILPAISPLFPLKDHKFLVTVDLPFGDRGDGWHDEREGKRISKIEDKLVEILESQNMINVGHIKSAGHLIVVFYATSIGPRTIEVPSGFLKKTAVNLTYREDPEWTYYNDEMRPSLTEYHFHRNMQLIRVFEEQGDNLMAPRPVDFGCLFPTKQLRESFLSEANSMGYKHSDPTNWGSPENLNDPAKDYWCELVIETHIEADHIAGLCVTIDELCQKHGGEFDGWAAPPSK